MSVWTYEASDEAATRRLGAVLAECLPDGCVVALVGTLGAGKTRLVQAIAESSGVRRGEVVSPTFVLLRQHRGRRSICHIDAYRLRDEDEFLELGPEEYFENSDLTLIEWADRVTGCLPRDYVEVRIEVSGPRARRFEIVAVGQRYRAMVERLGRVE